MHMPISREKEIETGLTVICICVIRYNMLGLAVYMGAKSLQSCPTLCNRMDCSPPGSSVHGILQIRILEWVAMSSSRDLPDPGIEPASLTPPALADGFFTTSATWETH